jgi:hypothetical protein
MTLILLIIIICILYNYARVRYVGNTCCRFYRYVQWLIRSCRTKWSCKTVHCTCSRCLYNWPDAYIIIGAVINATEQKVTSGWQFLITEPFWPKPLEHCCHRWLIIGENCNYETESTIFLVHLFVTMSTFETPSTQILRGGAMFAYIEDEGSET